MAIDLRECLYALSDVIINRPRPLRINDQIYMKIPDMLFQAELLGRAFANRSVVFIGDGDAISLAYVHLTNKGLLPGGPKDIMILDFDERVVNSINHFADHHGLEGLVSAELYNVIHRLPEKHWGRFDAFYTNPPWGASNGGRSVCHFVMRGIEACRAELRGCVVIGDHPDFAWTRDVQRVVQEMILGRGYRIAEMLPEFHRYHLDDSPELRSCAMLIDRHHSLDEPYASEPIPKEEWANFYGKRDPARYRYVRDLTNGGKFLSRDFELEELDPNANY